MEKILKKLKYDLLIYRHIYLIYWVIILISIGFFLYGIIYFHSDWYLIFQGGIILFLFYIMIFRLHIERNDIIMKADTALILLIALEKGLKSRMTGLMVLENEFDVLRGKKDGIKLIHERLINSYITSIDEVLCSTKELGAIVNDFMVVKFSLPDTIPELKKLIADLKQETQKDQDDVKANIEKIDALAMKF